jgi:hypothetical protein
MAKVVLTKEQNVVVLFYRPSTVAGFLGCSQVNQGCLGTSAQQDEHFLQYASSSYFLKNQAVSYLLSFPNPIQKYNQVKKCCCNIV